jgi:diguanylate cyclase (GGDEF)-like protein
VDPPLVKGELNPDAEGHRLDQTSFSDWPIPAPVALAVVAVLAAVAVALMLALRRASERQVEAERRARKAMEASSRPVRRLEQDLNFLFEFFQVFSNLLGELHAEKQVRKIPQVLLSAMVRIFRPEVAVVLVVRRSASGESDDRDRLVVAACHANQRGLRKGMMFRVGEGQAGIVAERQRVMVGEDFELDRAFNYERTRLSEEPNYDIVAPMVAGGDTLGVLAIARPERHHDRERQVLEMIARLGGLTWKNVEAYRSAKDEAEIDKLTGILNKGALLDRLSRVILEAREQASPASVFIFDIDHFKHYNDEHGHLAGDHLLRQLSTLVRDTVRSGDVFGRFGGEEFLLVMPGRPAAQAMNAAGIVRRRIEEFAFEGEETQPLGRLTVSGGVACFPDDAPDSVELLRAADAALYRAKHGGRNLVLRADDTGLNPVATRADDDVLPEGKAEIEEIEYEAVDIASLMDEDIP